MDQNDNENSESQNSVSSLDSQEPKSGESTDATSSNSGKSVPRELVAGPVHGSSLWTKIREAAGTVYGDIGTSVLYCVMELTRETIKLKHHHLPAEELSAMIASGGAGLISDNEALGSLSLVFWALVFLTIKYDLLIMRADNRGEGGDFALWGLLKGYTGKIFGLSAIGFLVVTAAGMLAADGVITPAISLLGAYEPLGEQWAVLATLVSLFVLFKPQWRGTSKVGGFFGWFMLMVWFPWIALKGIPWIFRNPEVFQAINPMYAFDFVTSFPMLGMFAIFGVVVLAITGGEAKYADIGHFMRRTEQECCDGMSVAPENSGRRPVMMAWYSIVLPCLLINYAGQVGYLLENGVPSRCNTYFALTPRWDGLEGLNSCFYAFDLIVAACAAFIASQALITGMFSIVKQAIALGFAPRQLVRYTSHEAEGQVYIPSVNWSLFTGCVIATLMFRTAGNLASAYGIAVTATMGITTITFGYVAYYRWNWKLWLVYLVCGPILAIDVLFFCSNLTKIASGGYFPITIAAVLVVIMLTWQWGRKQMARAFYDFGFREGKKIDWLVMLRDKVDEIQFAINENLPLARMLIQGRRRLVESDRAAVFLCSQPIRTLDDYTPVTLRVFLKKYGVLPSNITLFHINQVSYATYDDARRYEVIKLGNDIYAVNVTYGYMEQTDIRGALKDLRRRGLIDISAERWIIEVGEEEIISQPDLPWWQAFRVHMLRLVLRLSAPAHKYYGLTYDAGISKELIPVVFEKNGVRIRLPELEVSEEAQATC
ncbi:KUP/HAK/KT family potassium transporter [Pirellulaceae bacterium SH501]